MWTAIGYVYECNTYAAVLYTNKTRLLLELGVFKNQHLKKKFFLHFTIFMYSLFSFDKTT